MTDGEVRQVLGQGQARSSAGCARPSSSTAWAEIRAPRRTLLPVRLRARPGRAERRAREGDRCDRGLGPTTSSARWWRSTPFPTASSMSPARSTAILSLLDDTQATVRLYNSSRRARPAAVRVRAALSGLRADPDPRRDLAGAVVRRAAVAPRGPAGQRGAARGLGRSGRARDRGARRRRDRDAGPDVQPDDPPAEGCSATRCWTPTARSSAAAAVRFGAVLGHGRRHRA